MYDFLPIHSQVVHLTIVQLLTPSRMFTETSGCSHCQQKSEQPLNLLLPGWSLSELQWLRCPQPEHQCFQQHMLCFMASRMSFVKSFMIFLTLSHLLSSRALQMHTANSVIITIKLIHHHIISGCLVSVINPHMPLHVLIMISVLDPHISYDALQEDFADDSTLLAQLESSKLNLHLQFDTNYNSPRDSSNSTHLSSTPTSSLLSVTWAYVNSIKSQQFSTEELYCEVPPKACCYWWINQVLEHATRRLQNL